MITRTVHMADSEKPLTTLCGLPWEDWQDPTMPTDDEIGYDKLDYGTRVQLRKDDEARKPKSGDGMEQCPACFKVARNG